MSAISPLRDSIVVAMMSVTDAFAKAMEVPHEKASQSPPLRALTVPMTVLSAPRGEGAFLARCRLGRSRELLRRFTCCAGQTPLQVLPVVPRVTARLPGPLA